MGQFFYLIESVAIGLYIFTGLAFVWSIHNFFRARRELRESQFRLEREQAQQRGGKAMTVIFLSINILVAIWGTANMAAPTWRDGLPPTRNPNRTPIYQTDVPGQNDPFELTPNSQVGDDGIPITAPPPSTPKGTILPRGPREGCIRDTAWIDFPDNGQVVFDVVTVQGTANIQDFAFYRFEIRPSSSANGMFSVIEGDNTQPVENGPLGQLIPYNYLPGDYRYRLVVFDSASNLRASCEISIVISDPIPTQTPIGGPE